MPAAAAGSASRRAKIPRSVEKESYYSETPSWSVSTLETVEPFGWHEIGKDKLLDVLDRLKGFESMTWSDILVKAKKHNHTIPRQNICAEAQRRLEELKQEDVDDLICLKVSGRGRVWGIMSGVGTLRLVWWDPDHQICKSKKKNT